MENASKALIIAGSVLISMLVIAALIFTFSQVRSLRSQEQLSEQTDEVAEYNNKFNADIQVQYYDGEPTSEKKENEDVADDTNLPDDPESNEIGE